MAGYYQVKQGDHLSSIAKAFGFVDYTTIWNDPNNASLQAERGNPNVLYPGDQVYIPDKTQGSYDKPTDQQHKFIVRSAPPLKLRIVLGDLYEKPIAGATCTLQVGSTSTPLTTDGAGKLEQNIQADQHDAVLTIQSPPTLFEGTGIQIKIGNLDPVDQVSGQLARLNNLGYVPGDGTDAVALESAIEEFQCDNSLTVDGICGPQTQAKLKTVHGC